MVVHTASVSFTRSRIDESEQYYIGSWRRSPFDLSTMPQCLSVDPSTQSLCLADFDGSEFNNLWRFVPTEDELFVLELCNPGRSKGNSGEPQYISKEGQLTDDTKSVGVWEILAHAPFRAGPGDIGLQIRDPETGKILCSDEKSRKVILMDPIRADQVRDNGGQPLVNIAWEATPDNDESTGGNILDIPEWLQSVLQS